MPGRWRWLVAVVCGAGLAFAHLKISAISSTNGAVGVMENTKL